MIRQTAGWATVVLSALIGPTAALAPLALAFLVPLIGIAIAWAAGEAPEERTAARRGGGVGVAIVLLLAVCGLSLVWSERPMASLIKLIELTGLFVMVAAGAILAERLTPALRRRCAVALAAGLGVGIGALALEAGFGFPLKRLVDGTPPDLPLTLDRANRGVACLAVLAWAAGAVVLRRRPWLLPLLLLPLTLPLDSLAATVGLALGLIAAACVASHPRWVGPGLATLILAGILLALPIAGGLRAAGLAEGTLLPPTARDRVFIWGYTADRWAERPLTGWGLDMAGEVPPNGVRSPWRPDNPRPMSHPHNAVLQVWLELGPLGAACYALVLLGLLRAALDLPPPWRGAAVGAFVTGLAIAATGYGAWQAWWVGGALGGVVLAFALAAPRPDSGGRPGALPDHAGQSI